MAAGSYDDTILAAATRFHVHPGLIRAILQRESSMNPNAGPSIKGDADSPVGIAQMRPSTIKGLLGPDADPRDPNTAIMGAAAYLDEGMRVAEKAGYANPGAYATARYNAGPDPQKFSPRYVQGVVNELQGSRGTSPSDGGAAPAVTGTTQPVWNPATLAFERRERPPAPGPDEQGSVPAPPGAPGVGVPAAPGKLNIGVAPGTGLDRVDPRLVDIVNQASTYLPQGWQARIVSGYRDTDPQHPTSQHPQGRALDVELTAPDGTVLKNYQDPGNFRSYEQFAQISRKIQSVAYPELNGQFNWGGYFYDGGHNYGASDLMHLSIGEHPEAGTWEGGLNNLGKGAGFDRNGRASAGMGDVANWQLPGGGNIPVTRAVAQPSAAPGSVQVASAGVSDVPSISAGGAPSGPATVAPGRLPENWADVPGAPASMAVAPPSMFTAGSPEERTRWAQASTPAGYAALAAAAQAPVAATPQPETPQPPPRKPVPPPEALPGYMMPPGGGWQGWAGVPGKAGSPSGPTPEGAPGTGSLDIAMLNVPELGLGMPSATIARPPAQAMPSPPPRNLSDEEISRIQPEDVYGVVTRSDLTDADQVALRYRLQALTGGM